MLKGKSRHTEAPVWQTKQGRHEVRLELIKTMVESKRYKEALKTIQSYERRTKDPRLDLLQGMCLARRVVTEAENLLTLARDG